MTKLFVAFAFLALNFYTYHFLASEAVVPPRTSLEHFPSELENGWSCVKPETIDERDPREVDSLFDSAVRIVLESQRGSASLLQRALAVGYTRASRLIDLMRSQGIIGEFKSAQAADVLMTIEEYEEKYDAKKT